MCGISGIYAYNDGPVQREELLKVRDYMSSRGPDGAGIYLSADERLGLAHRRLSILDLSAAGAQPMISEDKNLVVTFNGEIYNYPALRRELEGRGCCFRSDCDTEVLLHLYAQKGEAMLHDLRGMFAFGLWDARKRALLLACDPFGMKPLYYADDGRTLRFASQVKALLAGGNIDTAPEPAGHVGFHLWGSVPQPYTLYRGIRSLAAGHSLWIDENGARKPRVYCNVPREMRRTDALARERLRGQSGAQIAAAREQTLEQLGAALRDSLQHHFLSDVPVSLFLSAGRDSATLAALASEVTSEPLNTVTLAFDEYVGTERDETPLAEELSRHYGTRQHSIRVRGADFRGQVEALFAAMDQPTIDGVNSFLVSQAAASMGAKVALSGLGGDELFGGYPSFAQIPRLVSAARPLQLAPLGPILGKGLRIVSARLLRERTSPKYASLLEYGGSFGGAYLLRRGLFMPWELPDFLDGELVREGWRELQTLARLNTTARGLRTPHLKISALETAWYMKNQLLRDTDWASMAHSLEVRTPLVDIELLRSVVALSAARTLTKADLASTPRQPLPAAVFNRKKSGFSVPVALWLNQHDLGAGRAATSLGLEAPRDLGREWGAWARTVYARHLS